MVGRGLDAGALGWMAALWGMLRLGLVWVGLEKWLPESRLARVVALALSAVLPAAAHLDGMITNETLVMLMSAAVFVVAPSAIAGARTGRIGPMLGLGVLLALALMSKVSASVLIAAVAAAIGLEIVRTRPPSAWGRALRLRALPLIAGALVLAAVAGPWFVRNVALYGKAAPSAYEGSLKRNQAPYEAMPYLDRRPIGFYLGWNLGLYVHPIYPTGIKPNARFFPVLLASTFNDYYVYSYSGGGRYRTNRSVSAAGVTLGCMSVMAGTAIALVTVIAWFAAVRALWRRREDGEPDPRFALLLAPLGALIGQIHFATKYPNDNFGPIKGAYLQFVHRCCARCSASASRGCGGGRAGAGAFRRWSRSAASGWSRRTPRTRAFHASARTHTRPRPSSPLRRSEVASQAKQLQGPAGVVGAAGAGAPGGGQDLGAGSLPVDDSRSDRCGPCARASSARSAPTPARGRRDWRGGWTGGAGAGPSRAP